MIENVVMLYLTMDLLFFLMAYIGFCIQTLHFEIIFYLSHYETGR